MELAGLRLAKITGIKFDSEGKVGYDDAVAAGVEVVKMSAPEMAKWKKSVAGLYQQWISDMNAKNLPGKKTYDKANQFLKKYEK